MGWNEPGDGDKKKDQNDPWNRGGRNQSPPDLDEALQRLHKMISQLFSKKTEGGGPSDDDPNPALESGWYGFALIIFAAIALWFLSGIYIVDPAQEAVVLRFGRYIKTVGPGPHWIPRFIETRSVVNVQKISNFSYTAEMLNKDENIVSVSVAVQYRINNPRDYLFNVVNASESLQQATASALRQVVGRTTLDQVLTIGREKVRADVSKILIDTLAIYKTGIAVTDVAMLPAKAPEEVKEAFDDAIKAQEDEQRYINQAQAYAARVRPIAEGQAKRLLQEAQAYEQQVILKAKGDVARFLSILPQYRASAEVTRERMYLDAMERVLGNSTKVLVDTPGNQSLMYLPLDQILSKYTQNKLTAPVAPVVPPLSSNDALPALPTDTTTPAAAPTQETRDTSDTAPTYGTRASRDSYRGRE